ncbi:MAG TPA: DUF1841 family protein [Casimicrobiaceae bacterium]|nr:DUF1841 family protein [Casimicrobiaceae bacterium]
MFTPSRDEARRFIIDAWTKQRAGTALTALERMTADIVALHPEYHPVIEHPEQHAQRDYRPEAGEINPFLHLSLHLAVAEQLSIDQPPGLRAQYERLKQSRGDAHAALHALVECLGEVVWQAQRHGTAPDANLYLACVERQK